MKMCLTEWLYHQETDIDTSPGLVRERDREGSALQFPNLLGKTNLRKNKKPQ